MDKKALEKNIRDWALALGFTAPNGSAPALNYFAMFTATPNRRQLCDVLLGTVKPRKQVDYLRKQMVTTKLLQGIKTVKSSSIKQGSKRVDHWLWQNNLEREITEKRKTLKELEKNILSDASDLMFETCKVEELKKNSEDYKEKILVLHLLSIKQNKLVSEIEKFLLKEAALNQNSSNHFCHQSIQTKFEDLENLLLNMEFRKNRNSTYDINAENTEKSFFKTTVAGENLWEEQVTCKNKILLKFSEFLDDLNFKNKNFISEKKVIIEKALQTSLIQLKQFITEKSLKIIVNGTEEQILLIQISKLLEKILHSSLNNSQISSLYGNISYLSQDDTNMSYMHKYDSSKIQKYLNCLGMKSYVEFLKADLHRLENDSKKKLVQEIDTSNVDKKLCETLKSIELVYSEIDQFKFESEKLQKEIFSYQHKTETTLKQIKNDYNEKKYLTEIQETIGFLKMSCSQQMKLFLDISLDAFKTFDMALENKFFAWEFLGHRKFKKFFCDMLISSFQDIDSVSKEIENRKVIVKSLNQFISQREHLSNIEEECSRKLASISYDSQLCEKNFKDSDGILWNTFFKADGLSSNLQFCFRILKNWLEQPYRLMIRNEEMVDGKTLKEYEEQYKVEEWYKMARSQ